MPNRAARFLRLSNSSESTSWTWGEGRFFEFGLACSGLRPKRAARSSSFFGSTAGLVGFELVGLVLGVLTGASTRGIPNRAARCLRFSSSGSTVVEAGVDVFTGGETAGTGMVAAGGAGVGFDVVSFGGGVGWSAFQSISSGRVRRSSVG